MKRIQQILEDLKGVSVVLLAALVLVIVNPLTAAPLDLEAGWQVRYLIPVVDGDPNTDAWTDAGTQNGASYTATAESVTLNGPDIPDLDFENWFESAIFYSFTFPTAGTLSFDWSYAYFEVSADPDFPTVTPSSDPAGYVIGQPVADPYDLDCWVRLIDEFLDSDLDPDKAQNGSATVHVQANQALSFFVLSMTTTGGRGLLEVSNADFTAADAAAVPEPGPIVLFATGLVALLGARGLRRLRSGKKNQPTAAGAKK